MEQDGIFAREIAAGREPRPAAIVGAAGFLGSALAQNLGAGGIPVAEFTRTTPFLTVSGTPAAGLLEAHTVFWLASNINPAIAEAKPQRVREDFATFVSMLRIFEQLAEPPRIVLLSSGGAVYDPTVAPPHSENSPVNPRSAYGRAKLELERLMHGSGLNPGNAVAVRVSNAYGPGQPAVSGQGVISYWMRALAAGEPITILGNPATTRDFVYIDDIAEALVAVHGHRGPLPAALNIGAGVPTSLEELADLVREVAGADCEIRHQPPRGFDAPHSWLDVRMAADLLAWKPRTPLRVGLATTWDRVRRDTSRQLRLGVAEV